MAVKQIAMEVGDGVQVSRCYHYMTAMSVVDSTAAGAGTRCGDAASHRL
jgi:hypothetical protein